MIPEKMTGFQFPARTSAVYSKLYPINDLVFQVLNKHYMFPIKFLTEYQIRKYIQLCCIKLYVIIMSRTGSRVSPHSIVT